VIREGPGRKREREREGKVLLEGWKRGRGGLDIPIKGGARVRPGDRALLGKTQAFPSKFEFAWEKKRGGRKGGRGERRWAWKMARASAKAKTDMVARKRRSVTVTANDGLNPIREAQDEGSRIGTKPSGVMTR
jgi:hypothetical protein